jgi:CHASE1-domain containing sensor protein/two-component sensor histidine kinase
MRALIRRHLPKLVFLLALGPGLAMTWAMHISGERRLLVEFERAADLAVDRVVARLEQHVVVLRAARGLLSVTRGDLSRDEFLRFLDSIDLAGDLSGVQGVGFARMLAREDHALAEEDVRRLYGLDVSVHPVSPQSWITPIVLLEPANGRNIPALGFDMYADDIRRSAMDHAIASGEAQMSGPVELVQEITENKQTGFLVYLPFQNTGPTAGTPAPPVVGFVYAPFRGADLIQAALAAGTPLPVSLRVVDTGAPETPLFDGIADTKAPWHQSRSATILGRQWQFDVQGSPAGVDAQRYLDSLFLVLISLLFAAAAASVVAARQAEAIQARERALAASREADYRALLLQEMKHRIKNHIARIQSISRQSARGATDVKAFTTAFDARLQAMSAVQEILAGTAVAEADLRDILLTELQQSRDTAQIASMIGGPPVKLDERQAHAFALVAHELVTNAMKYGGLSTDDAQLRVNWTVSKAGVRIDWIETFPGIEPTGENAPGFGSRLIEASLKGELSGSIERDFSPGRLHIRIGFPLKKGLARS